MSNDISDKNRTNRKWVSTKKYRDNHEKIFGDSAQQDVEDNNQDTKKDN